MERKELKRQLMIVDKKEQKYINIDDIILCVADGNNSDIYTTKGTYRTIRLKIGEIEQIIKDDKLHNIFRVGKSYLINLDGVESVNTSKSTVNLKKIIDTIKMPPSLTNTNKKLSQNGGIIISSDAMKKLLLAMDAKKRKEVLEPMIQPKLTVHDDDLNAEHLMASGNEYVDLGLPSGTKWSLKNLGTHPDYYGGYYQWNMYSPSETYDKAGYHPEKRDCVNILWGDNWRMPTLKDFKELEEHCILTWCISKNNDCGCLVTGTNGNRIFIPAYGMKDDKEVNRLRKELNGIYWTSEVSGDNTCATTFSFSRDTDYNGNPTDNVICYDIDMECTLGLCIRPVIDKVENETSAKKRLLIINNCFEAVEMSIRIENRHLNCMSYEPELPVDPEKAMLKIKELCARIAPDLIVGYGTGCFFVHQLNGYDRLLVNPVWYPSTFIPIDDGEEGLYTQEVIDKFSKMETSQFDHVSKEKRCWIIYNDWNEELKIFCEHYDENDAFELISEDNQWMEVNKVINDMLGRK